MAMASCSGEEAAPGPSTDKATTGSRSQRNALNASQIERRRQKKKYAVKRLEKKLETYNRQIKRSATTIRYVAACDVYRLVPLVVVQV